MKAEAVPSQDQSLLIRWGALCFITIGAILIWLTSLKSGLPFWDIAPVIAALPVYLWLLGCFDSRNVSIWREHPQHPPYLQRIAYLSIGGFFVATLFDSLLLFSLSWSFALAGFLITFLKIDERETLFLIPLSCLSFPWLLVEGDWVGWFFRYSGAVYAEMVFSLSSLETIRQGTDLLIAGVPVSVGTACAGIGTLQSMLIAGVFLAWVTLSNKSNTSTKKNSPSKIPWLYIVGVILIPFIAWIANTLRIIAISFVALAISPQFARDIFHDYGGLIVLILTFGICAGLFNLLSLFQSKSEPIQSGSR